MQAVAFDTLKLARKLESAGFPAKQAQDASAALAETFAEWQASINLATREDVQKLEISTREDLKLEIHRIELAIQKLEAALRQDMQKFEAQTNQRFAEVNQRIAEKAAETIKWVIGMSVAQAGLIIGILKLHG
jgi:Skp family chaperone for outer membrane proteins